MSLATITADHHIGDDARFAEVLDAALDAAETQDALVVCGIVPAYPETGFGYIQVEGGAPRPGAHGVPVHGVRAFHEKPGRAQAQAYLDAGGYFWNSGMFFWRISTYLAELHGARPAMAATVEDVRASVAAGRRDEAAARFAALEDLSIDVALLERARTVRMVPGDFPWGDVGLWPAVDRLHAVDADGNCVVGEAALYGAKGSIVFNAGTPGARAIGVAGVENLVVVVTDDAVLVVPKDRAGDVRGLVAELRRRGDPRV